MAEEEYWEQMPIVRDGEVRLQQAPDISGFPTRRVRHDIIESTTKVVWRLRLIYANPFNLYEDL